MTGITRHEVDGIPVVEVSGEVDDGSSDDVRTAVAAAVDDCPTCVLDLTGVTFLNPAGLTALVTTSWQAIARRGRLRIVVDGNRTVIRPLEITGLDEALTLHHSVEEALAAEERAAQAR
ncbi:STAS domain-containing protein [Actinosynnema sp. NPDC023587]|uniref:STAS domain-containing protein n=1 Tax=Actinosynnema sp. NPDC023587 TaxID=3154695 RepID=UPI0033DBBF25